MVKSVMVAMFFQRVSGDDCSAESLQPRCLAKETVLLQQKSTMAVTTEPQLVDSWPTVFLSNEDNKCNPDDGMLTLHSQAECQEQAEGRGHGFYSFRHDAEDGVFRCFSSLYCNDRNEVSLNTNHGWKVYANPANREVQQTAYIGCFLDDDGNDLGRQRGGHRDERTNTVALCHAECQTIGGGGTRFMALQKGGKCFCSDSYGTGAQYAKVDDQECDQPCTGSTDSYRCGGIKRNAIYRFLGAPEHGCLDRFEPTTNYGVDGAFVEWVVTTCSGGPAAASFRYRVNAPFQVQVNGVDVSTATTFPAAEKRSGRFIWHAAVPVSLISGGENRIRLSSEVKLGNTVSLTINGHWH